MQTKFIHLAAFTTLCITFSASAADGTVNFTGNISDTTCAVDTNSSSQTVDLGTVSTNSFSAAGATASVARFSINLTGCPSSVTSSSIRFDGPAASGNSNLLALTSGQTATNVGVGIYQQDSTTLIPLGKPSAPYSISSTGPNVLNFVAKYVSTAKNVGPGSANAAATFTITYN